MVTTKSRNSLDRATRVLDLLDSRVEALGFSNDHRVTPVIDDFHTFAGHFERRVLPFAEDMGPREVARSLRRLRRLVSEVRS